MFLIKTKNMLQNDGEQDLQDMILITKTKTKKLKIELI